MKKEGEGRKTEKTVLGGGVIAIIIWWLLRGKAVEAGVDADILDFGIVPAVGSVGNTATANVYWQNTGVLAKAFDIHVVFEAGVWEITHRTEIVPAGQAVTTSWEIIVPSVPSGIYDATVMMHGVDGSMYDSVFMPGAFQVLGVSGDAADIEGLVISGG